jgi:hypothetical protein
MTASVAALSAERYRLETAITELEKTMATPTDTDGMIRTLAAEVAAEEQRLAEKRELLARAEAQRQTLARDAAAAREAADREAVAACQARLGSLLDRELELVARAEALARELLDVRKELLTTNAEARTEAGHLGRADVVTSGSDLIKRMSLRESKAMSELPGCRHQYGHVVLPSSSFGLVPDHVFNWREDEARHQRNARALVEQEA